MKPADFRDEEGVSIRSFVNEANDICRCLAAGHACKQPARIVHRKATEAEPPNSNASQFPDGLHQRLRQFVLAIRRQYEHTPPSQLQANELEQHERTLIETMQILEHDHEWNQFRGTMQKRPYGVHEPEAINLGL